MSDSHSVELLLVEDNPQDLELTLRALKKSGLSAHVHVARDGVEAMEFLFCAGAHVTRQFSNPPKVVLLDLQLPQLDGLEVIRRVKGDARTKFIPIVVLTSSKEQRDVVESYQLGVNSYIVRPVNSDRFTAAVRELGMYWLLLNQPPKLNT